MKHINLITRRSFMDRALRFGASAALASLVDFPFFMKTALAQANIEGSIGRNGKKLLFIFLRGANDALNSVVPVGDDAYRTSRPSLFIPTDPAVDYTAKGPC